MDKQITLIAAMATNRGIGLDGGMPWHLPAELQHFKRTTMGKALVMGRKTWQSIGKPLPGRQNIVVTRNHDFIAAGADVAGSLEAAMDLSLASEIMVIGGGQLYTLALPHAHRMVLTLIEIDVEADTWFPCWVEEEWHQTSEIGFESNRDNQYRYRIVELRRRVKPRR